jgi:hypothetical protein
LLNICNFYVVLYIYHFFYTPKYLTGLCLLCIDVGPVRPTDYVRNKRRPRPEVALAIAGELAATGVPPVREAERVLRRVERNFTSLTRTVLMVEIEDLPLSMQPHVVGAPQTWVRLFRRLTNSVDHYNRANMPRP